MMSAISKTAINHYAANTDGRDGDGGSEDDSVGEADGLELTPRGLEMLEMLDSLMGTAVPSSGST